MLNFLFKKRECETAKDVELNRVYEELKKVYTFDSIRKSARNTYLCIFKNTDI